MRASTVEMPAKCLELLVSTPHSKPVTLVRKGHLNKAVGKPNSVRFWELFIFLLFVLQQTKNTWFCQCCLKTGWILCTGRASKAACKTLKMQHFRCWLSFEKLFKLECHLQHLAVQLNMTFQKSASARHDTCQNVFLYQSEVPNH